MLLATVALLARFQNKPRRLADLQMNFVAGVSHELRTPLTVIRTAAFNLKGACPQPGASRALWRADSGGKRETQRHRGADPSLLEHKGGQDHRRQVGVKSNGLIDS